MIAVVEQVQPRHRLPDNLGWTDMNAPVAAPKKVWTEAELQALPEDGFIHELVDGEIVMSPKNDSFHGDICTRLIAALLAFAESKRLGAIWDSSTGFRMNNLNVRAPDISFISRARLKAQGFKRSTRRFFPGAPDLAVEVLSLNNTQKEIDERLKDFFSSGTLLAWIIDPKDKRVEICHSFTERRWVGNDGFLDGEDLLPGFHYPIVELFKAWDWE
jgi:Uma2 family endonuclease